VACAILYWTWNYFVLFFYQSWVAVADWNMIAEFKCFLQWTFFTTAMSGILGNPIFTKMYMSLLLWHEGRHFILNWRWRISALVWKRAKAATPQCHPKNLCKTQPKKSSKVACLKSAGYRCRQPMNTEDWCAPKGWGNDTIFFKKHVWFLHCWVSAILLGKMLSL
jgi:hypothetical protein